MGCNKKLLVFGVLGICLLAGGTWLYLAKGQAGRPEKTNTAAVSKPDTPEEKTALPIVDNPDTYRSINQRHGSTTQATVHAAKLAPVTAVALAEKTVVSRSAPDIPAKPVPEKSLQPVSKPNPKPAPPPPAPATAPAPSPPPPAAPQKTSIMGTSAATANQLEELIHLRNPSAPYLSPIYFQMERIYGIRADIAFLQMVKETNAFQFTGDVSIDRHNPAGIGALGGGAAGASFNSWTDGIEAQFQHLLAYASTAPIPSGRTKLDPRFDLVRRGSAPYVEWLGKADNPNGTGWAAPGNGYGASILKSLQEALSY